MQVSCLALECRPTAGPTVCIPRSVHLLAAPGIAKREPSEQDEEGVSDVCDYCQYEESQGQVGVVVLPAVPPGPTLVLPQDAGTVKNGAKRSGPGK